MEDSKCSDGTAETNDNSKTKIDEYYKQTNKTDLQNNTTTCILYIYKSQGKFYPHTKILAAP